ncbi:MAG: flavodoxin family protein [Tissierella sp.]|uniref:flavodoxin family protein n=1 Tax=Tissierella sp. TaxID=41274 RepID=UPI003F955026
MSKSIILFYSFEGSTKKVAEYLSEELNIPWEQVKPKKDLKSKGFSKYPIGGGQVIMKKKPELEPIQVDLNEYDTIFLGSPIWAGTFAPAIRTVLEDGILKDKNIAFFYTHDGGPGKCKIKIRHAVSINNTLISSYGLAGVKQGLEPLKNGLLEWTKTIKV